MLLRAANQTDCHFTTCRRFQSLSPNPQHNGFHQAPHALQPGCITHDPNLAHNWSTCHVRTKAHRGGNIQGPATHSPPHSLLLPLPHYPPSLLPCPRHHVPPPTPQPTPPPVIMHSSASMARLSPVRPMRARCAPDTPPCRAMKDARLSCCEGSSPPRHTATDPTRSPAAHRQRARIPAAGGARASTHTRGLMERHHKSDVGHHAPLPPFTEGEGLVGGPQIDKHKG